MPTYLFQCKKCKHEFQDLCLWEEVSKVRCEKCNSKTERLFAASSRAYKGSGTEMEYNFEKNYEKATQESAAARKAAKSSPAYKHLDDIQDSRSFNPDFW